MYPRDFIDIGVIFHNDSEGQQTTTVLCSTWVVDGTLGGAVSTRPAWQMEGGYQTGTIPFGELIDPVKEGCKPPPA